MTDSDQIIDSRWGLVVMEPNLDIRNLFQEFKKLKVFEQKGEKGKSVFDKKPAVFVSWTDSNLTASSFMHPPETKDLEILLSKPLLSNQPRKYLMETLLHEMIHAYLYVTNQDDEELHGNRFHQLMCGIMEETGLNIEMFHSVYGVQPEPTNRGRSPVSTGRKMNHLASVKGLAGDSIGYIPGAKSSSIPPRPSSSKNIERRNPFTNVKYPHTSVVNRWQNETELKHLNNSAASVSPYSLSASHSTFKDGAGLFPRVIGRKHARHVYHDARVPIKKVKTTPATSSVTIEVIELD